MEKKAKVPKLRFPGFAGDWEERKLGDLSEKVMEKNIHHTYTETLTNSAEYGIISQRDFFDKDISNNANLDGYYVVKNDAFVYNPRISTTAPVGPIKRNKLGRTGVVSPLYYVFQTHDIDNTFLETYFSTRYWHQFMKLNGDSGARADRFAIKDAAFKEMPLPYPVNEEQQCIGAFFEQIDNLINLHQRKLTHLQEKKKSLLQKMFPKKGERVPEIRFPGFTDAWEQRKLGDIVDFLDEQRKPLEAGEREKGIYPYYGASGIIDYVKSYLFDDELILLSEDGANIIDRNYRVCFLARGKYWVNNHAHVMKARAGYCNGFICESLERLNYSTYNTGTAQPKLNQKVCRNILCLVPSYEEQQRIFMILSALDNLITLHQRKLTHLQTQKKALLQQMFV